MRITLVILFLCTAIVSCKTKNPVKKFVVKGTIHNSPAKKIYLEEVPMATMQRILVDSAEIGKEGFYEMTTGTAESRTYFVRLDQYPEPITAIINDAGSITVDAWFSGGKQFPDSFNVNGSAASTTLRNYMVTFYDNLQEIFINLRTADSLARGNAPDSVLGGYRARSSAAASDARILTSNTLSSSSNPALTMFVLGYYQTVVNGSPGMGLEPFSEKEVKQIVSDAAAKNPDHPGLAAIKTSMEGWVGKQAPEIKLPDPNGKEISLSSFRGKYVLVDFWASWCLPCRQENPNLVRAYNKYKDKNFTILGVSLDRPGAKDDWMKAVMNDQLAWTQVSDLMEWSSPVVQQYKINGIPFNVLVDPEGKIVAEALRGEDLDTTLQQLLK